jgi:probable HAF family extracellular repeat protein
MKSLSLALIIAALVLTRLAAPNLLAAQEHHHYKLIDMGTFGGPWSYLNGFEYYGPVKNVNNAGELAGWADLRKVDPNCSEGNSFGNFCFNYDQPTDCFGQLGCPGHVSHAFQWQQGVKTDLGVLPGGLSSATAWISANGLIAGASQNGETDPLDTGWPEDRAVLWRDGKIIDLGTLPEGGYESGAQAVNSRGQVVGWAYNTTPDPYYLVGYETLFYNYYQPVYAYEERAFLWEAGVMRDLGTLGTGNDALAMAINERGQVIGLSYTNSTANQVTTSCGGPAPTVDPFLWDERWGMIDLGTLGGICGYPNWINNFGQVVGVSDLAGDQVKHAFLWTQAKLMQDLGTLGGDAEASMINDSGVVVGGSNQAGNSLPDAFLWDGQMHDLGTLDGSNCAYAFSINERMQVVGNSGANCGTSAFLWEDQGPMVDLSTLILNTPGFISMGAININDRGEVAGIGVESDGNSKAFLLIPCDENHPGVEGCDYSLVHSASPTASQSDRKQSASPASAGFIAPMPPHSAAQRPKQRPTRAMTMSSESDSLLLEGDELHRTFAKPALSCTPEGRQCPPQRRPCCKGLQCVEAGDRAYCEKL